MVVPLGTVALTMKSDDEGPKIVQLFQSGPVAAIDPLVLGEPSPREDAAPDQTSSLPTSPPVLAPTVAQDPELEERIFRLQLKLDLEVEKALMYRVLVVGEVIVLLALGREWWNLLSMLP